MLDIQQFQLHLTSLAKICQKVNTILVNRPGHPFYSSTLGVLPRSGQEPGQGQERGQCG